MKSAISESRFGIRLQRLIEDKQFLIYLLRLAVCNRQCEQLNEYFVSRWVFVVVMCTIDWVKLSSKRRIAHFYDEIKELSISLQTRKLNKQYNI